MAYATTNDVAIGLGRPASSTAETDQWQAWLESVERKIERAFRRAGLTLADQVALGDPTPGDIVDVEVAAVIRKIQNPTWGETSSTVSIDDGSVTTRREGDGVGDPLALLASEIDDLLPNSQASGWSTRPGFEPDTVWPVWL